MSTTVSTAPEVRRITVRDLRGALAAGFRDFARAPVFGLSIAALFVFGGLVMALALTAEWSSWAVLMVALAFPLVSPLVVVGLYDVSHRLELGERPTWSAMTRRILQQKDRQIPSMVFVVIFFVGIWFFMAHLVFALSFGISSDINISTPATLFLSREGLTMLTAGSFVGAGLGFVLYSLTVVCLPLIVDRDVDFVTGMITSVSVVLQNLWIMVLWAAFVGIVTFVALIPAFLGLFVVLPVLGHATWHLYRRAVVPV